MVKHIFFSVFSICFITILFPGNNRIVGQSKPMGVGIGVHQMANDIVNDLHTVGPIAWLKYFTNSKQFFMASDGILVFPNIDSATAIVYRFAKQIHRVELTWDNIRVDSLSPNLAIMAAAFHEIQIGEKGVQDTPSGYFTGVVEKTLAGWKFRDAHWSSISSH